MENNTKRKRNKTTQGTHLTAANEHAKNDYKSQTQGKNSFTSLFTSTFNQPYKHNIIQSN